MKSNGISSYLLSRIFFFSPINWFDPYKYTKYNIDIDLFFVLLSDNEWIEIFITLKNKMYGLKQLDYH